MANSANVTGGKGSWDVVGSSIRRRRGPRELSGCAAEPDGASDYSSSGVRTTTCLAGYRRRVPYPPRPQLRPLPEFAGSARSRPDPAVQAVVERFIVEQYAAGRSLRELAELTDRSFSAVRNILTRRGVRRREAGADR